MGTWEGFTLKTIKFFIFGLLLALFAGSNIAYGESQENSYPGITDPFGDPATYEFAEDEKADKEFFHLGRFIMFGFNIGAGIFTGGLGRSAEPSIYFGGKLLYFFDRSIAFEAAGGFANTLDVERTTTSSVEIDTNLIPLTLGLRYYFDIQRAPKAVAAANPYLAFGGGAYIRSQTVLRTTGTQFTVQAGEATASHFGAYAGAGVEFPFYRRHLYLGLDVRYHFIFFADEDENFNIQELSGERGGDYFTPLLTFTYSF